MLQWPFSPSTIPDNHGLYQSKICDEIQLHGCLQLGMSPCERIQWFWGLFGVFGIFGVFEVFFSLISSSQTSRQNVLRFEFFLDFDHFQKSWQTFSCLRVAVERWRTCLFGMRSRAAQCPLHAVFKEKQIQGSSVPASPGVSK